MKNKKLIIILALALVVGFSYYFIISDMTSYLRSSQAITGKLSDELVMMDIDRGLYFSLNHSQ